MSKYNKAQKQEIRDRIQRDAVARRKRLAVNIRSIATLQKVNDGQAELITELRTEVERLKSVDSALSDFNYERFNQQREDFAREGFEEVKQLRQFR